MSSPFAWLNQERMSSPALDDDIESQCKRSRLLTLAYVEAGVASVSYTHLRAHET